MGRRTRICAGIVGLGICQLMMSVSAAGARPSDEQIRTAVEKFKAGYGDIADRAAGSKDFNKLAAEALAGIDIAELSAAQLGTLLKAGSLIHYAKLTADADARLRELATLPGVDGAIAATHLLGRGLWGEDAATQERMILSVLRHPKLEEAIRSGSAGDILGGIGSADTKTLASLMPDVLAVERLLTPELGAELVDGFETFNQALQRAGTDADLPVRERIREKMIAAAKAAAKAESDSRRKGWIEYVVAYLDGAAGRGELVGRAAPDLTFAWSSEGELTSVADLKGKVVVLDFWATWCAPCVASFPKIRALQEHYKNTPVVIIGVTSLQGFHVGPDGVTHTKDDPAREYALMSEYIRQRDITWTVVFSEQSVFNPHYGIGGIPQLVIIDPGGKVRHRGLHAASPMREKTEKIDAILREFNLPVPAASEPEDASEKGS